MVRRTLAATIVCTCLFVSAHARAERHKSSIASQMETITRAVNSSEQEANRFNKSLRKALGRSTPKPTAAEDQLRHDAGRLENALDQVGHSWNRDKDVRKTHRYVLSAIGIAKAVNKSMVGWRRDSQTERAWVELRGKLDELAEAFDMQRIAW